MWLLHLNFGKGEKSVYDKVNFEEEVRSRAATTDNLVAAERHVSANQNGLEEAHSTEEQTDRPGGAGSDRYK